MAYELEEHTHINASTQGESFPGHFLLRRYFTLDFLSWKRWNRSIVVLMLIPLSVHLQREGNVAQSEANHSSGIVAARNQETCRYVFISSCSQASRDLFIFWWIIWKRVCLHCILELEMGASDGNHGTLGAKNSSNKLGRKKADSEKTPDRKKTLYLLFKEEQTGSGWGVRTSEATAW